MDILMTCSIIWLIDETFIILCPCKKPFVTDIYGTTNIANETQRITKATSSIVFPPVISPIIKVAIGLAKTNKTINTATDTKVIIFLPIL